MFQFSLLFFLSQPQRRSVSALCSGLLTIGPRFGGALDDTAKVFRSAYDRKLSASQFVQEMHQKKELIPGIGHRVKSVQDPDSRVKILIEYARANFDFECPMLEYALEVEKITSAKKGNLILNVDGCIACLFTDLVRGSGYFDASEEVSASGHCLVCVFCHVLFLPRPPTWNLVS